MKPRVYIDGKEGTTGLQIYQRLGSRDDIELITAPDELRKDTPTRKSLINSADLVFLCLPDAAAKEAVSLIENPEVKVIDASTAHRTALGWVYGFPELCPENRAAIKGAARVANPGCHATGFISAVAPLVKGGFLDKQSPITGYSITGYSGGGKQMIGDYTAQDRPPELKSPRIYGTNLTNLNHKHVPEMMAVCGLTKKPLFSPVVADYYCGMATAILLHNDMLKSCPTAEDIRDFLGAYYQGEHFVKVPPFAGAGRYLNSNAHVGTNRLELLVYGDAEQTIITVRFDNLGKGASGAAVQNMNLMLGFDETEGLV